MFIEQSQYQVIILFLLKDAYPASVLDPILSYDPAADADLASADFLTTLSESSFMLGVGPLRAPLDSAP